MPHYSEPWLVTNRPSAIFSISTNRADFIDFEEDLYTRWDPTYGTAFTIYGRGSISVFDSAGNQIDCRDVLYIPDYPWSVLSLSQLWHQGADISVSSAEVCITTSWDHIIAHHHPGYADGDFLLEVLRPSPHGQYQWHQHAQHPSTPPAHGDYHMFHHGTMLSRSSLTPAPQSASLELEPSEDDLDEEAAFNAYLWELEHLRLLSLRQPPVDDLHAGKALAPEAASEDSSGTHTEVGTDTASGAVLALPVLMASAADIFVLPASSAQLPQTPLPPPLQPHTPPAPQHFEIHRDSESRSDDDVGLELSQLIHERGCSAPLNLVIPHCVTDLWFLFQQQKVPLGTVSLPLSSAWGNPIGWWKCRSPITRAGIG